jgi:hypothetical protein
MTDQLREAAQDVVDDARPDEGDEGFVDYLVDYATIDALRAALEAAPPAVDVERLAKAMDDAYEYGPGYIPTLPFVDNYQGFWRPFAALVASRLGDTR